MQETALWFKLNPDAFTASVFVLGLIIGSFLNVVIHRLPIMLEREWKFSCEEILGLTSNDSQNKASSKPEDTFNLAKPDSHCPHCKTGIKWHDNVPVLSWLWLRGKCRNCSAPISSRYPMIELLTGLVSAWVAWHFGFGMTAFFVLILSWMLISLCFIDYDHQLLPDIITLPLLWLGLLVNSQSLLTSPQSAIIGATVGYLSLWSIHHSYRLATGKEGMGYGDFKLLAALGAWAGWQLLPLVILLSSLTGALIGISLILLTNRSRHQPIPFGPYLAIAGWITLFWGESLMQWYINLLGGV